VAARCKALNAFGGENNELLGSNPIHMTVRISYVFLFSHDGRADYPSGQLYQRAIRSTVWKHAIRPIKIYRRRIN
jgi:hypothetical protein